ncbi:LysR family transcriptional regulator [Salipiger sp. P9]|uniref:LysR family transcriptional regulator n=1 Tax=Salipiger pentaromativorans TaxID=2943193 RepID=UPI0021576A61|nr:LysR family transcriptional regulator [Salipiger pentaromativorans]MCR8550632.1 LysR family transcriptional regulator [Salipiger pentaromativorans]
MASETENRRAQHSSSPLTPRVCEMLVALERHRNMGETATELGVLQSVLSRQLAGIEKSLGVSLFARTTRSMEPTNEGLVLVRQAAQILASLDRVTEELDAIGRGSTGLIRLGIASVAAAVLAPQAIAVFQKANPGVTFSIRDDTSDRLINDLTMGHLDAAILRLPAEGHFQLDATELYDEPIRIVARGGHPLADVADLSLAHLAKYQWILPTAEFTARKQIEAQFYKDGLRFEAGVLETLSVPLIIGLVSATDAVTPLADSLARRCEITEGFTTLAIDCPLTLEPVSMVWRKESYLSPALTNFMKTLEKTAKLISRSPETVVRNSTAGQLRRHG